MACQSFGLCCTPGESPAREKQIGNEFLLSLLLYLPQVSTVPGFIELNGGSGSLRASLSLVNAGVKQCLYKPELALSNLAVATSICLK